MKKTISILLALVLIFALASCGKKADETPDKKKDEAVTDVLADETIDTEDSEQNDTKDEVETGAATGAKPETKPEIKPETKPEVKPETNPGTNPEVEPQDSKTVAGTLRAQFQKIGASGTALSVAEELVANPVIQFMGAAVPVEPGYLTGFDNAEIKGFSEGAMFAPAVGTIPFVGYVFTLDGSVSADDFVSGLKTNANLRWNICTQADEMVTAVVGNKVFFVMSPKSFEE